MRFRVRERARVRARSSKCDPACHATLSHTHTLSLTHSLALPVPPQDKFLKFKYDASTVEAGKAHAKAQLQREAGLPQDASLPVFGFIGWVGGRLGGWVGGRLWVSGRVGGRGAPAPVRAPTATRSSLLPPTPPHPPTQPP